MMTIMMTTDSLGNTSATDLSGSIAASADKRDRNDNVFGFFRCFVAAVVGWAGVALSHRQVLGG